MKARGFDSSAIRLIAFLLIFVWLPLAIIYNVIVWTIIGIGFLLDLLFSLVEGLADR